MKKLHLINVIPDDPIFLWQTMVNLRNQREYGLSDKARVLVFLPHDRLANGFNGKWKYLENKFPEVKFFYYPDNQNILRIIQAFEYIPLLRPYCLEKHWEQFPELKNDVIYYHDSDTVFTQYPSFLDKFKDDNINYLSDTKSYLNSDYFQSKTKDVKSEKAEEYSKIDPLAKICTYFGIDKQVFIDNKDNTGGAQYLLKNIDKQFWIDVFNNCIEIRSYLRDVNRRFYPSEDQGFQSWCADMWAILGNLWRRNSQVITPKEMDFCWATDYQNRWTETQIYHDANGISKPFEKDGKVYQTFFKRGLPITVENKNYFTYEMGWESPYLGIPFYDNLSFVSQELCSYNYVNEILKTKREIL